MIELIAQDLSILLSISVSGQSGYASDIQYDENNPPLLYPVYEGGPTYSATLSLSEQVGINTYPANFTLNSFTSSFSGISATKSGSQITITGSTSGAFTDMYYDVMLRDKSIAKRTYDEIESDYLTIIKYSVPSSMTATATYTFNLTVNYQYGESPTTMDETITLTQAVYWQWFPAINQFKNLVSGGKL